MLPLMVITGSFPFFFDFNFSVFPHFSRIEIGEKTDQPDIVRSSRVRRSSNGRFRLR
jgi:hypothetical protein